MSFSSDVRDELKEVLPESRHCMLAEACAFSDLAGTGLPSSFCLKTERNELCDLVFTLFKRAFNIELDVRGGGKNVLGTKDPGEMEKIRSAFGHPSLLRLSCCRRAYLRGAFLAAGSVSAPEKSYHLEITADTGYTAEKVAEVMRKEGLDARIVVRKKDHVVYLKEADQIVTFLGIAGASRSFLDLENVRVLKDMRGRINRSVNCETANLDRVISSAVKQAEDIRLIAEKRGLQSLSPALREMAELRLAWPEASFTELGNMADPKIGKSGVHHRLRKLSAIAEELKG